MQNSTTTQNATAAFMHSLFVQKGAYKAGEAAIASDTSFALRYARDVLNGRFEAGEAAIFSDPQCAYQ